VLYYLPVTPDFPTQPSLLFLLYTNVVKSPKCYASKLTISPTGIIALLQQCLRIFKWYWQKWVCIFLGTFGKEMAEPAPPNPVVPSSNSNFIYQLEVAPKTRSNVFVANNTEDDDIAQQGDTILKLLLRAKLVWISYRQGYLSRRFVQQGFTKWKGSYCTVARSIKYQSAVRRVVFCIAGITSRKSRVSPAVCPGWAILFVEVGANTRYNLYHAALAKLLYRKVDFSRLQPVAVPSAAAAMRLFRLPRIRRSGGHLLFYLVVKGFAFVGITRLQ